ncbi:MAG: cytochrome c biogenesis protein CcsA, partial [Desulfuromonadales bacterium]|nr:cytochrome c biogenesis protein CcsA [Desulfuromonadales bacterium]
DLNLFWVALAGYLLAGIVLALGLKKGEPLAKKGVLVLWVALAIHTISLGLRWQAAGHLPGNDLYELNSVGGWLTVAIYLWIERQYPKARGLGVVVLMLTIGMMLYGVSRPHAIAPLSDEYQSGWFFVHILSAFYAYGCYVIATAAGLLFLVRHYRKGDTFSERLPSQDLLENLNGRLIAYGFCGHAIMLASGSIWANSAWGRYWGWDPVETWSLITWLIYAFHLHARTFLHWKGHRLAWITVLALIAIVFTFWGVPHLPTQS